MKVLKVFLVAFLILQTIVGGLCFFMLLPKSFLLAILYLAVAVLQIALTGAVIRHCGEVDDLWYEVYRLRGAVRQLQKAVELPEEAMYPIESPAESSRNVWECIKCGAVNKSDTTHCSHCGAAYDASVNPTDDPTVKRKVSRWVKDGKKRHGLFSRESNS